MIDKNVGETGLIDEQMRKFRIDRISKISSGNTPTKLIDGGKVVLHFLPLSSFSSEHHIDMKSISNSIHHPTRLLISMCFNFDGLLRYGDEGQKYIQIFPSGIIEYVTSIPKAVDGNLFGIHMEYILDILCRCFKCLGKVGINPPTFLCLTLVGVKGQKFYDRDFMEECKEIDRDILKIPEIIIETYDVEELTKLFPMFDMVWNACGMPGMPKACKEKLGNIVRSKVP